MLMEHEDDDYFPNYTYFETYLHCTFLNAYPSLSILQ